MDYFTPIKVGWIRPGYIGEIYQLTITSYDHFHGHPSTDGNDCCNTFDQKALESKVCFVKDPPDPGILSYHYVANKQPI